MMATCRKCLVDKPCAEFTPDKRSKSGHHSWCKTCRSLYTCAKSKEQLGALRAENEALKKQRDEWHFEFNMTVAELRKQLYEQSSLIEKLGEALKKTWYGTHTPDENEESLAELAAWKERK